MPSIDAVARRGEAPILLLGRAALAALYLPSGWSKLTNIAGFAGVLATKGLPGPAMAWAVVGAAVEFFGSLAILLGFKTRYAALLMIVFTLFAAFLSHNYWTITDPTAMRNQFIHFWKDIALIGGFLVLFTRGAGPLSVDRR
ncbi:MAG TPA: DoxX family protein [Stellaceae bacterium]|nr:DoxX family protein [Stellaceae bacterium]